MVRIRIRAFVVTALMSSVGWAAPAWAQGQGTVAPAIPAQAVPQRRPQVDATVDVQQVKDELNRLRREFDAMRQAYDARLAALEAKLTQAGDASATGPSTPESTPIVTASALAALASARPTSAVPVAAQDPVPPQDPVAAPAPQAAPQSGKVFNPDMSVNGNFVGVAGKNPFATLPALQLTEVEAAFQAIVDPYARADFFLSASPEGLEVEEGYITFTTLPAHFQLKVGKMRAQFGKMNTLHTHGLPSVDRPLVTTNLVGGEEGISDPGMSVSRLINNPLLFLELTGEVYSGTSEVFQSTKRSQLLYVGRVHGYRDVNDAMNVDFGSSIAYGPATVNVNDPLPPGATVQTTDLNKRLVGFDATFRYRPPERAIYRRLNVRTEFIWSRQEMPTSPVQEAFGFYVSGEYQFARRWFLGARGDHSGRALDGQAVDNGGAVFLTFWPTEFSQIRSEYREIRFAGGERAHEFLFQFNFSIGAHGAHAF
jgi:hypothetical protein